MDITVNSFVRNVMAEYCCGPKKPQAQKDKEHQTLEEYNAQRDYNQKLEVFVYNANVAIADGSLVGIVAVVALAAFSVIGPVLALVLGSALALTYYRAASDIQETNIPRLGLNENLFAKYNSETGQHEILWNQTAANVCDLVSWFNFLPSEKKEEPKKANNGTERSNASDNDYKQNSQTYTHTLNFNNNNNNSQRG